MAKNCIKALLEIKRRYCDHMQGAYNRMQPAYDCMQTAYDHSQPKYDHMLPAYARMQGTDAGNTRSCSNL